MKAKHDEAAIYEREITLLTVEPHVHNDGMDWIAFTVAFKGVLLEGLEVAFIVITFGASAGQLVPAAAGAALAAILVTLVGVALHRPLARVPENGLKFVVGVLLTAFGTFWAGEGIGIDWPLGDAAILVLAAAYAAGALAAIWLLQARVVQLAAPAGADSSRA